jgi:hypothetical protein
MCQSHALQSTYRLILIVVRLMLACFIRDQDSVIDVYAQFDLGLWNFNEIPSC